MGFPVRIVPFRDYVPRFMSYVADGMLIFPATGVFAGLEGVGVSMFFVSQVPSVVLTRTGP